MIFKHKDRNCKCNHMKFQHEKHWGDYKECTVCNCNEYLRRDSPTFMTKISAIIGVIILGFGAFVLITTYAMYDSIPQEDLDKPYEGTVGEYIQLAMYMLIGIMLIGFIWIYQIMIADYFVERTRKIRD